MLTATVTDTKCPSLDEIEKIALFDEPDFNWDQYFTEPTERTE